MADLSLTDREHGLLVALALGYTRDATARMFDTSPSDLSRTLMPVYERYGVHNTTALVAKALVLGHLVVTTADVFVRREPRS